MFYTMFFAFFAVGYQVVKGEVDLLLAVVLFAAAFTPKVISKFAETIKK